jgi:glutamyl-tRNA reductase
MNLFCIGISHHATDLEVRERFAGSTAAESFLREKLSCSEALLLTTCNRVEVYGSAPRSVPTEAVARCLLRNDIDSDSTDFSTFYRHEGEECVKHLFRVASGLDSMVVGETEVLGQVKKAYADARQSGSAGPCLHRLFQRAFRVAKHVRTRTEITRGAVSVGSVAVDLAGKIFGDLRERKVLLLGAGEASERTARALLSRGAHDIRVSNRAADRAEALAGQVRGRAVPFDEWREQCREVDILISSTAATFPLLTREILEPLIRDRMDRPLFIIDIAVPRDVSPEVNAMDGVYLYDIDSLRSIAEQSLASRRQQIAAGDSIISEHVAEFRDWFDVACRGARPQPLNPVDVADAALPSQS